MQRRGGSEQPVKGQSAIRPEARNAPTAQVSTADLQEQLDLRTRERDEAREQLAATSEVLKVISRTPGDLQPVFRAILENAVRICEAKFGSLFRFDGENFHFATEVGTPQRYAEFERARGPFQPRQGTQLERIMLTKQLCHTNDYSAETVVGHAATLGGARSLIGVPMLKDDALIGVILIYRQEVRPFTDKQVELVKNFAAQAVIAIENTRLLNELRESLQQQTATADVLKVISRSTFELQTVFETLVELAARLCEADMAAVVRQEGSAYRQVASYGFPADYKEFMKHHAIPMGRGSVAGRTMLEGKVVHIPDVLADPDYKLADVSKFEVRTLLGVPLLREGSPIGVIVLERKSVRPFTDSQIALVTTFADQAVIAIENVRLFEAEQVRTRELAEALEQQTATSDVLSVISSSPGELKPVFELMLENAVRICEAKFGVMLRYESGVFHPAAVKASEEFSQFIWRRGSFKPPPGTPLDRLLRSGGVIYTADDAAEPNPGSPGKVGGARSLIEVPMLKEKKLVGAIVLYRLEVRPFTEKQIELVKNFAAQAVIAIENTRLLNELRQRTDDLSEALEQQTATSEVLKVISSSPGELKPVFDALLANAVRICDAKFGVLFLSEGDAFRYVALHGAPPAFAKARRREPVTRVKPGTTIGRVAATKKPAQTADIRAEPAYTSDPERIPILELAGARTILGVPMLKESQLVGAIVIYRQEVRPFTDKQIDLLSNFAAQAVIAIENARLLNELRESLQQQTATSDVLKVIASSTGELAPVFNALLANATRLCDASYGILWLREGDAFRTAALHGGLPRAYLDQWRSGTLFRPAPDLPMARVAASGQPVQVTDLRTTEAYRRGDHLAVTGADVGGIRTVVGVPMFRDKELVGVIAIYRTEVKAFADKQIELVTNFAAQAVIAIENTRLLSELRESLQQQTATADVLKVISRSTFDLQAVLDTLVELVARLCEAEMASINREKGAAYQRVASYGYSPELQAYMDRHPIPAGQGSVVGRTVMEGGVIHIHDVLADPDYKMAEAAKLGGIRTMLGVPLLREGTSIGVLVLQRKGVRPFTDKQIELATTFADQAVIAIENARLLSELRQRTTDLSKSLEDLRTTQDRLVQTQKLASLGQLTAGIAHEIKNPLNFVNNFSGVSAELIDELREALKDVSLNEKRRSEITELMDTLRGNLDKVMQHGKRADAIVKNMLLHSREGSAEHRVVDINALVEESLNLAYHGARAEKQGFTITLERSLDPAAGAADIFPQDITRALLNLISNGFYAATKRKTEANGGDYEPTLTAVTKNLGNRVEITIRDNGTGIPPDVKEKMFNPFFTTKPAGEGTGLGLSISHDIVVKQHGGSIEVDTRPGEFTEFRIVLPRAALRQQ